MSQPFIGEIRMAGFSFDPKNWEYCNGQMLSVNDYPELYTLIGTTYGGNGMSTFALPDLRGRVPVHQGGSYSSGSFGGVEVVTLSQNTMPEHGHLLKASESQAQETSPEGHAFASTETPIYTNQAPDTAMYPNSVSQTGGSRWHDNMQPFETINFIIATRGLWPEKNA